MDKQSVINFAVNNDKLELLKAKVNRFNPIKVLKMQDYEIRHSNILAWLLNPLENHNLDDKILKRFLSKILLNPDNDDLLDSMDTVYTLQQKQFTDLKIYREYKNIDLLLVSPVNKLVVLIENKIYASESQHQLKKYYDSIYDDKDFVDYTIIPVFLTLDGSSPTHEKFFTASYDDLLDTLTFILENFSERTSSEIITFVNYYIRVLKEKYVMDEELRKLCKEIYIDNKDVVDMIYNVGNEIDFAPAITQFKNFYTGIESVTEKNKAFWFGLEAFLPGRRNDHDSWGGGFPVCFWFNEYWGKLKLVLEVGPFDDASKRIKFLETLQQQGVKIKESAKQPGKKYTRIFSQTVPIKDWGDEDEVFEAMKKLFNRNDLATVIEQVTRGINQFQW
ncbi:hypothetical protein M2145_001014 [Lachnospiraceae bacterium PF1-21]|uniref:PDDEXK-like family protein n=1 Tax=Ohessyouella blattaphilus TaxID=2949333 RepID=UPI003E2A601F